jgi:hypothetical protein
LLPAIKGEAIIKGDFIEVRQANAHAWTEVWLQGKGWVRYAPTTAIAPERVANDVNIEQQIARQSISFASIKLDSKTIELLKSALELWSSVDYSWQRWVINYTRKNQPSRKILPTGLPKAKRFRLTQTPRRRRAGFFTACDKKRSPATKRLPKNHRTLYAIKIPKT